MDDVIYDYNFSIGDRVLLNYMVPESNTDDSAFGTVVGILQVVNQKYYVVEAKIDILSHLGNPETTLSNWFDYESPHDYDIGVFEPDELVSPIDNPLRVVGGN